MINYLFSSFIIIGIIYSFITGNTSIINNSIISSGKNAIEITIGMIPIICLWLGIMKIAENSNLLQKITNYINKIITPLFPELKKNTKAKNYIASNIIMNMFGLGNAATPFGLLAMQELQKENKEKEIASRSMITFLVINTASVTLIPTTVIAMRTINHSKNPTEILLPSIIVTILSFIIGVTLDKVFYQIYKRRDKND